MRQLGHCWGNVGWCGRCGKQHDGCPQKVKDRITMWPSNSTSRNMPKRLVSREQSRCVCISVHSSTAHNIQKAEATHVSTNRGLGEQSVQTMEPDLPTQRRKS